MSELVVENTHPDPVVASLRRLADLLEAGAMVYRRGGLLINQEPLQGEVTVTSDLVIGYEGRVQ